MPTKGASGITICPSSRQPPTSTRGGWSVLARPSTNSVSSRVLPTPASPPTTTTAASRATARRYAEVRPDSCSPRPTKVDELIRPGIPASIAALMVSALIAPDSVRELPARDGHPGEVPAPRLLDLALVATAGGVGVGFTDQLGLV